MQKILLTILAFLAGKILARHKPHIIGITGTVGKTTITTHVTTLLRDYFGDTQVGASEYHYNGEFGLPLTIIGAKTGGKNIFRWASVVITAIWRYLRPYPKYLVLEYGIDHPDEMDYLLSIAIPDIAIISRIAPNHLEQFGTIESYRSEKLKIAHTVTTTIIAHESLRPYISREAIFYGVETDSFPRATDLHQKLDGLDVEVSHVGGESVFTLPVFGEYQVENILPLFPVAEKLHIPIENISKRASLFLPEAGRSYLLRGTGDSIIIDGSYNGGFESMCRGIDSIVPFLETHRAILFLGDMRELGLQAEDLHVQLARHILTHIEQYREQVIIYLVGPLSLGYMASILEPHFTVEKFLASREAGKQMHSLLLTEIRPTLVYVKGSQNTIFLEEGVKEILANHEDRKHLCRQSESWISRKESFFRTITKNK